MTIAFDVDRFKDQLRSTWVGSEFIYIERIDSTNTWLKKLPSEDLVHGTVVLADQQTRGRGQYEKNWESAACQNLTFTVGLRPPKGERLSMLTLAFALAISKTLREYSDAAVSVKWPNDLLANGKKIGGILTECIFTGSRPDRVLIGIGLNIHQKKFSKNLARQAVSLCDIANRPFRREDILSHLLLEIEHVYHRWHKYDSDLQKEINQTLVGYGEWVQLSIYDEMQSGRYKFIGISDKGELLMLNEELDVNKFSYEQIRIIPGSTSVSEEKTGTS